MSCKTVFVLGAGASEPYGYPIGTRLKDLICETILGGNSVQFSSQLSREIPDAVPERFILMADHLQRSNIDTIDSWLNRNSDYTTEGKIAIAYEIMKNENNAVYSNWYGELWKDYLLGNSRDVDALNQDKYSFITFNYDRSLEHHLYRMLNSTFSSDSDEMKLRKRNTMLKFKIIHVHGQLGLLPWQNDGKGKVREYKQVANWGVAKDFADGIRIVEESECASDSYLDARELLLRANRIVFLGFGYHDDNLKLLFPKKEDGQIKAKALGTAYKMSAKIKQKFMTSNNKFGQPIKLYDANIMDLMKELPAD